MKLRHLYILACILGTILPLRHLYRFLSEQGLDVHAFFAQLYSTPISALFASDVTVSAIVLILFMSVEGRRLGIRRYRLALLGLAVGVSLALPWFLYLRQCHLDAQADAHDARKAAA
jgi:hypothetical protein